MKKTIVNIFIILCLQTPLYAWAEPIELISDIEYSAVPIYQRKLDIYRERDAENLPVILYIHGELWGDDDKADTQEAGYFYANHGALFISVNYRTGGNRRFSQQPDDIATALSWIKNNISDYGGMARNIIIMGPEDGGWLAAKVATDYPLLTKYNVERLIRTVITVNMSLFDVSAAYKHSRGEGRRQMRFKFGALSSLGKKSPIMNEARPDFILFTATGDEIASQQAASLDYIENIPLDIDVKFNGLVYTHDLVRKEISRPGGIIGERIIELLNNEINQ